MIALTSLAFTKIIKKTLQGSRDSKQRLLLKSIEVSMRSLYTTMY